MPNIINIVSKFMIASGIILTGTGAVLFSLERQPKQDEFVKVNK